MLVGICSLLFNTQSFELLNANIQTLSKKHGQLRQAVQKMVEECMTYLDKLEGEPKLALIETLRDVTEGKVSPDPLQPASA